MVEVLISLLSLLNHPHTLPKSPSSTSKECNFYFNIYFCKMQLEHSKYTLREFPGGPVVRTLHFYCRRHRINPSIPHAEQSSSPPQKSFFNTHEIKYFLIIQEIIRLLVYEFVSLTDGDYIFWLLLKIQFLRGPTQPVNRRG